MGLFENIMNLGRGIKALSDRNLETDEPQGFQGEGVFFGQQPPKMRADQYLKAATGWVYGCVARISNSIAAIDLELYQIKGDKVVQVESHDAIDLLDKINNFTTRLDHFYLTQEYLELTGEAPWYVARGEDGKADPENIMLLRPDRLTIVQNDDKTSGQPISGYIYRADANTEIKIKPSELIFLKYPDPINYFRGTGTLEAAAKTVDIDNFSEDYNKRFFYNSARPDMILSAEQKLTQTQRKSLDGSMRKLYQGAGKAHKTLILESGLKATPFALTQKDMDFLEQQRFDMAKIFSIFGVPKSVMSVSDDVNLANAKVGEYIYMKYTIVPKLKRIVAQLNEFYLPMFKGTEQMFFSFDNPVPQDTDSLVRKYDSALGKGWMTHNEVRAEQDLEDAGPDADNLLVPIGLVPIGQAGEASQFGQLPAKAVNRPDSWHKRKLKYIIANSSGGYEKAKGKMNKKKRADQEVHQKQERIRQLENKVDQFAEAMVKSLVKDRREAIERKKEAQKNQFSEYGGVFLGSVKNFERAFAVGTTAIFRQQEKTILSKVPTKAINVDDWLLDEEAEAETMVRVYTPLTKRIIKDSGTRAAKLVAADAVFDAASKPVQNYLNNHIFDFSFEVNKETNKKLQVTLAEGVSKGESIPQLRGRVSELFNDMEKYRSERIARTEVVRASNFAATEAYEQTGLVDRVQWLTTEDDRTDDECQELDGKVIELGDSFANNDYFGDVEYPPIHANCRCTVVPIVS